MMPKSFVYLYIILMATLRIHVSETKAPDVLHTLVASQLLQNHKSISNNAHQKRSACHILLRPAAWHNSPIVQACQKGCIFQSSCIHEVSISFQLLVQVMARYLYLWSYTINTGSTCYDHGFSNYKEILGRNILCTIHSQKIEKILIRQIFSNMAWEGHTLTTPWFQFQLKPCQQLPIYCCLVLVLNKHTRIHGRPTPEIWSFEDLRRVRSTPWLALANTTRLIDESKVKRAVAASSWRMLGVRFDETSNSHTVYLTTCTWHFVWTSKLFTTSLRGTTICWIDCWVDTWCEPKHKLGLTTTLIRFW